MSGSFVEERALSSVTGLMEGGEKPLFVMSS